MSGESCKGKGKGCRDDFSELFASWLRGTLGVGVRGIAGAGGARAARGTLVIGVRRAPRAPAPCYGWWCCCRVVVAAAALCVVDAVVLVAAAVVVVAFIAWIASIRGNRGDMATPFALVGWRA